MKKADKISAVLIVFALLAGCSGAYDFSHLWFESDVVVTDIDGDGRVDVITVAATGKDPSHREGGLEVYRQTTPGVFTAPDSYAVGTDLWKITVGDIDGDGRPDLIVGDVGSRAVWLLLQSPSNRGKFLPARQIASGVIAYDATISDFNGDGAPDIAITDNQNGSTRIVLLYQDPLQRGTFLSPVDITLPGISDSIASGDLNGDGRADLFTWMYLASSGYTPNGVLGINLQQSNGTMGPATTLAPQTGLNAYLLAIADFNGDGKNDLFVFFRPSSGDFNPKFTVLLQGALPGTFSAPIDTSLAGVSGRDGAAVADLNGDGLPDAALVGFFPSGPNNVRSQLTIFIQSGSGAFTRTVTYEMPIAVSRVAAGDIDGDGRNDLVLFGSDRQCLVMLQSRSVPGTFEAPHPLR